jgi:hypothetical protein
VKELVSKYAFLRIAELPENAPEWPEKFSNDSALFTFVSNLCSSLETLVPKPLDIATISASPGAYIPVMKFILNDLETVHQEAANTKGTSSITLPRLFSLCPTPSFRWRYVSLNAETLASFFTNISKAKQPADYSETFYRIFDFSVLRIYR